MNFLQFNHCLWRLNKIFLKLDSLRGYININLKNTIAEYNAFYYSWKGYERVN